MDLDLKGRKASPTLRKLPLAPISLTLHAKSLDVPRVAGHPNRMPFTGILTKVGVASDSPPNGTDGKKVLLTTEAAEGALDSLLGMGINLRKDMKGHDPQSKVGVITSAIVDGTDLKIEGFIYASDFPAEALKIHLEQADLGFSFEAQNIAVESLDDDPLIVKSCVFTGAAILMKSDAAYQTTALAASKAKEHEMDEMKKAIEEALAAALGPVGEQIKAIAATQSTHNQSVVDLAKSVDEIKKGGPSVMANAVMCAKMEPHASKLEAAADDMAKDGVGLHSIRGHVAFVRRLAAGIRADAAAGKVPHEYHDSGSYWAGADQGQQPKIEDNPTFKAMQAEVDKMKATASEAAEAAKKAHDDALAAAETKIKDLQASVDKLGKGPDRKTLSPAVMGILSKVGLEAPNEEGGTIPVGKIDAALKEISDPSERLRIKTSLLRSGVASMNGQ